MINVGKYKIRNYMTMEYSFCGIRLHESFLTPVTWNLSTNIIIAQHGNVNRKEIEAQASLYYQKIYFWLEANLPGVVILDATNPDDLYIANMSANPMLYCPTTATDDTIVKVLHAKLSTLADGKLFISEMKIKSSDGTCIYTFDCVDGDYELPKKSNYYGEIEARHEKPWWFRNDGFCFEFAKIETEDGSDPYEDIVDPMENFQQMLLDSVDTDVVREPAKIVKVEKWQPKKV